MPCDVLPTFIFSFALPEMTLNECPARAGFQIALEGHGGSFINEFDRNHQPPRPVRRRIPRAASVVIFQTCGDVAGQSNVRPVWIADALEKVHESLGGSHVCDPSNASAIRKLPKSNNGESRTLLDV